MNKYYKYPHLFVSHLTLGQIMLTKIFSFQISMAFKKIGTGGVAQAVQHQSAKL
jgi:hypothetical protein